MGDLSDAYGGNAFNPGDHEPAGDFTPLPPGDYHAFIEKAEVKDTKKKDGQYLKLQFSIVEKKFDGRKVFSNINLSNPNQKCVEIGIAEMTSLGLALGLASISDTSELIEKVLLLKLKVKAADGSHEAENEVRAYKPADGNSPVSQPSSEGGQNSAQPATKNTTEESKSAGKTSTTTKPPWER